MDDLHSLTLIFTSLQSIKQQVCKMNENLNTLSLLNSFSFSLLLQVAQEFRFSIETVAVSVNYFDRLVSEHVIPHTQLQTHALACIYIASKQVR